MPSTNLISYGGDLMLFAHTGSTVQPMAFSTSAKLSISNKLRDISSKDSGDWTERATGRFDWNVSADGLIAYAATGTTQSIDDLYGYMVAKLPINIVFAGKTGTSPSWTVNTTTKKFKGSAYIESIDLNSPDGETATYSISLQGTGALTMYTV